VTPPAASTRLGPRGWIVLGVLAALAGAQPSFSLGASLLVLAVGGALFCAGMTARHPAMRRLPRRAGWWAVPFGLLLAVEAATFAGSSDAYPTLSDLADPWLERYPVRAGAFLAWAAVFWALARR
jgi:tellurite resistance protein TehA-like permease